MEFKALKQIDSISVEDNVSMKIAKKFVAAEVKELVDGRNYSLQCQVLPKDKKINLNDLQQSSDGSRNT
jgi:hypothetical protein